MFKFSAFYSGAPPPGASRQKAWSLEPHARKSTKTAWENLEVAWENLEVPWENLEVPWENLEVPWENLEMAWENLEMAWENLEIICIFASHFSAIYFMLLELYKESLY